MPTIPDPLTWTNVSADVINAIRNTGSMNYRDYIPVATPDADSIRHIGSIIMDAPNLRNAFATDLVNMIIKVIVTSKSYESPLARLKKGKLDLGETVEEIFVNIAHAELYSPSTADQTVFKRRIPDIRAAFHVVNSQVKYPVTISNEQLGAAFRSQDGLYNLIEAIYEQLYTADAYDEFNITKYLIADHIVHGRIKAVACTNPNSESNVRAAVTTIKATSNKMRFMTADYNIAGVKTHAQHAEQTLLISAEFDAAVDVNVLAAAFNMDKAEFLSKRILVDSFGEIDVIRLAECAPELCTDIVTDSDGHVTSASLKNITSDQLTALNAVPAVLIDDEFIQIYDRLLTMEEIRNADGLYTNAFYHVWRIYSTSPFAPAAVFDTTGSPAVTEIAVTPASPVAIAGGEVHFSAAVTATGFVNQSVNWSVSGAVSTDTYIDAAGNLHVGADESATELVVAARSVNDSSVYDLANVTIGAGSYSVTYAGTAAVTGRTVAIAGTLVTATRNIGSTSSASGFTITVKQGTTDIPYTATVTGSGSNHVLNVKFAMPHGNATVTVSTT